MPKLDVEIPHSLTKQEAMTRIKGMLEELKNEHRGKISDLREKWNENGGDFSLSAMGFNTSGSIKVTDKSVRIFGDLPFAAAFFKGKIEDMIEEKGKQILS